MAEANKCVLNEASSHSQLADKKGLTIAKSLQEQQADSLHKMLQMAAFPPTGDIIWAHPVTCKTPQNLFLEGFRDCASEVIRFLTEDEHVDNNNPLLIGLQSHLMNVSKTICHETITDLDRHDSDVEKQKCEAFASSTIRNDQNDNERVGDSQFSPCMLSPIVSRSANSSVSDSSTSVSDSSTTESDISMSLSSTSEKSDLSLILESRSSMQLSSIENSDENLIDELKVDDVFHSPSVHNQSSASNSVASLRLLSLNALQNINNEGQMFKVKEESVKDASLYFSETSNHESLSPAFSMQYLQSMNHSSPLPESSAQTFTHSEDSCSSSHFPYIMSNLEANTITHFPTVSAWNDYLSINTNPTHPNRQLSEEQHTFLHGNSHIGAQSSFQTCVPFGSGSIEEPPRHSDLFRQINSVLELKASLQTGIETSSTSSDSFADILVAVESCRFHEDPRVRALAEELVHLIHNDEYDDEDDDISDDQVDDDDDNGYNINEGVGFESGVEMLDESDDWGSVVDMIEQ